ncbi:glycosyl transferase family 2 [Pseudoduganella lurida]|uniref:Glycosyl transferase family 2 n=1 Tax=Pseudoduganella lurida TaxID=1036180 RepID=A0A562QWQ3_9BURK|nr:glycosyltransferase [Pseudoduganella lurida]TWI60650.1 glycosyl transferase family 2 [Pseudoduganella lurida]
MTTETTSSPADDVFALINAAQELVAAGRADEAERRYRDWLAAHDSPLRYAVQFNLAQLLAGRGADAEAMDEYRRVIAAQPAFAAAYLQLGLLLRAGGHTQEALDTWSVMLGKIDPAADLATCVAGLNHLGMLLEDLGRAQPAQQMYARSLQHFPQQPEIGARAAALAAVQASQAAAAPPPTDRICEPDNVVVPMVSILIPTHNRPDYAELALQSALAQTWRNIEIVISDNSDDGLTEERFAPYAAAHPCIRYVRIPSCGVLDNFRSCLQHARGEYLNFLMDDDLFHPQKLERMMDSLLGQSTVGFVTSFRQLIDGDGHPIEQTASTARLMDTPNLVGGPAMARHVLLSGMNVIGEPTTVLFRRSALREPFGELYGQSYQVITDLSAWFSILSHMHCVYLPEALSFFRIHGNQDQRRPATQIRGAIENLRLLCDVYQHTPAVLAGADVHGLLTARLTQFITLMANWQAEVREHGFDPEVIQALVRQATGLLLDPPAR